MASLDFGESESGDNGDIRNKDNSLQDKIAVQAEPAGPKTRAERLALVSRATDTETEDNKNLVVKHVKQLRAFTHPLIVVLVPCLSMTISVAERAMKKQDKEAYAGILDKVADAARKQYGPNIWGVAPLATDGFAHSGSMRQERLARVTTSLSKVPLNFTAEGKTVDQIRDSAKALCIPNPTDDVLGIDELTDLRAALQAANETRELPLSINDNRKLATVSKTAIGDMLVPEDVAVRWWLMKKREKRARELVEKEAKRRELIKVHATMDFLLMKMDAETNGEVFDPERAEAKALRNAEHTYRLEKVQVRKRLLKAARRANVPLEGPLVKPKGTKRVSIVKRKGPKRALYKPPKKVKAVGKSKTKMGRAKRKLGFGSQRKKRSGISGGTTGASRFKKRKGK